MSFPLKSSTLTLALIIALAPAAQAAEFVYQGQLDDRGAPANGRYDLRIAAFGNDTSASVLMAPLTFADVEVKDGRFELRFDAALANTRETWLELAVRAAGGASFSAIPGRSKAIAAPLIGACWSATGDTGSNPATNFLGTTDAQPLVLRTANVQSLRIEPSAELFGGSPITANVIAGSSANFLRAGVRGATIGGGGVPLGDSDPDFAIDYPNFVGDHYGTVGGGFSNRAGDYLGTVADRAFATVAGGYFNHAEGYASAVGGGEWSSASGRGATVGGGNMNTASSDYGMVPGGYANCAGGAQSFAGGTYAKVRVGSLSGYAGVGCSGVAASGDDDGDEGSFVWADAHYTDLVSSGPNQFLVRADGGVILNHTALTTPTDDLVVGARTVGGDADADLVLRSRNGRRMQAYVRDSDGLVVFQATSPTGSARFSFGSHVAPAGSYIYTGTGAYLSSTGVWTDNSSRSIKTGFAPVDAEGLLDRVLALPISEWSYRAAPQVRHVGPVAEDFHASFGLGEGETHIASLDTGGVALAAIQGLNAKVEAKNAEIVTLRGEIAALRALVEARLHPEH